MGFHLSRIRSSPQATSLVAFLSSVELAAGKSRSLNIDNQAELDEVQRSLADLRCASTLSPPDPFRDLL